MTKPADPAFEAELKKEPLYQQLQTHMLQPQDTLAWRHEFGSTVTQLKQAVIHKKKGWFKLKHLAQILRQSTSNLTKHRDFADRFTLPEAKKLDDSGKRGLWGMVTTVLYVADKQARDDLLDKALAKGWNLEELKIEIGKKHGLEHAGGRRARVPKSPELGLRHLDKLSLAWLRYYKEVWVGPAKPLPEQLEAMTPQRLAQAISETKETIGELEKAVAEVKKVLGKL